MLTKFLRLRSSTSQPAPEDTSQGQWAEPGRPIYLISMASWPNYGDELITLRWLQHLAVTHPTTDIWLDVREPGLASSLFAGLHPRLHITNTIFRALHEHLNGDPRTPADKVKDLGSPRYDLGLLDLRSAGSIHLLGGGYINHFWADHLHIVQAMRAARDISGAKLYATGQGLMPFAGEHFADFDHISVRDTPSAQALNQEVGLDDAYLLPPAHHLSQPLPQLNPQETDLYICLQSDTLDPGAHQHLINLTRQQILALGIPRHRTYYLEAIPGDDRPGYQALADLIADDGFIPFAHFWRAGFTFAPHQVWITSRFHHHVMASAHGARGIALSGKKGYYDVKHSSISDLGSKWPILTANTAADQTPYQLQDLPAPADFTPIVTAKQAEAHMLYPSVRPANIA